jgi:transmembrane sensor
VIVSSESPDQINAQAAAWLARREGDEWSGADADQLQRWIDSSVRHRVAFLRLEYVWNQARRLKALGAGDDSGAIPPPGRWRRSPFASLTDHAVPQGQLKRIWRPAALAASVVAVLVATSWWLVTPHVARYQTTVGALETVAISDGSRVTLNTDSEVRVMLDNIERGIQLERGEAFFEVAKDPRRPFVVHAGTISVTAVGTQFAVRRKGLDTFVVVAEGVVRVRNAAMPSSAQSQAVQSGQTARVTDTGLLIQDEPAPQTEDRLSWRTGVLVFRDARLEDAVAEFNRYNARKIVIAAPALKDFRIAGSFRATSTEAFTRLLQQGFPLRVEDQDGTLVLLPLLQ